MENEPVEMTQEQKKFLETERGQKLVRAILAMHPYRKPLVRNGIEIGQLPVLVCDICEHLGALGLVKIGDVYSEQLQRFVRLVRYNESAFMSLLKEYE